MLFRARNGIAPARQPNVLDEQGEPCSEPDGLCDEPCALKQGNPLQTIYFGGGTPSLYAPHQLQQIIDRACRLWRLEPKAEITVEVNPDDVTDSWVDELRSTVINRVSLGVQSFIDRDLQFMNRRHNARQAVEAVSKLRKAGFDNISADLIWGLPSSTMQEWCDNIDRVVELGVEHISAYTLSIEPNTPFGKRGIESADEQMCEQQYALLCERLAKAGYEHYEISNFALPTRRSRHNAAYWSGEPYLGLGPSAHSYDGTFRSWVVADVKRYVAEAGSERIYQYEQIDRQKRWDEYVMTRLRTKEGIDFDCTERLFGAHKLRTLTRQAQRFVSEGLLVDDGAAIRFDPSRWLVADSVICELFE